MVKGRQSTNHKPSLTLTYLLEAKWGLSLGRPHFVSFQQVLLLDLAQVLGHLSCLPLCRAPCRQRVNPKNPNPSLTLTYLLEAKWRLSLGMPHFVSFRQVPLLDLAQVLGHLGCLPLCRAPDSELTLKTQFSLTLTCPLEAKHGLSLGPPHFVGFQQASLLDLAQVKGTWPISLCPAPESELP